jgi:NADH-quinone oxidoreductase subunit L
MTATTLATLTVLLPGLGALFAALLGYSLQGKLADNVAMALTTTSVIAAAVLAWVLFLTHPAAFTADWLIWIQSANWQVSLGVLFDKLSSTMFIVVTTVSACVHVYSIGYMANDPSRRRFFIYLSVFTLAMLLLVSAPNLIQMFLGWEGVGVCSYLLIGFWHHKATANAAAIKAFIVNRVSDAAMLMGLFTLVLTFGSFTYADVLPRAADVAAANPLTINIIALFLFIGAMGKSAQFGLHTWLPDAMEGPTPVSALIHAATMVTAGVFLLCRLSPLYEAAPQVLHLVGWVGAITAIFAATVGLTQTDIKRVIAYSTCSQLGYMFFAIGVSAYPAAMFHLTTHAFFKALLFLGAGSVIHGLHHEQNIFKMAPLHGSLIKLLPITYGLMWIGSLALAGIPPFAGFFSKDLILESAYMAPGGAGLPLYLIGTLGAFLTAIYSFRVLFMAFHAAPTQHHHAPAKKHAKHADHHHADHHHTAHESPWVMLLAMAPLAAGAILAGYLLQGMMHLGWWQGAIAINEHHNALEAAESIPLFPKLLPLILAASGIAIAYYVFAKHRSIAKDAARTFTLAYALSFNKWYIDELYDFIWVKPTQAIARFLAFVVDKKGIDGVVNGTASTVYDSAQSLRQTQTGYVYHYAFAMLVGLALGLGYLLWRAM